MSVNFLVNKSLRRFVDWDRYAEGFDLMEIGPSLLSKLMERQSLDEARELGRLSSKNVIKQLMEQMFVDLTLDNMLEFLRRTSRYTRRYHFEESVDGRKHVLLIKHMSGLKWSAYYEGALCGIFEEELGIKLKVTIGPESCIGKFEV